MGEVAGIPSCLVAAEAAASALGDTRRLAWVSLFRGQLAWWIGVSPKARDFAEHAERTADAADDRSLRITAGLYASFAWCHDGDGHRGLGRLLGRARHPDAEAHLRRAAALAREMEIALWQWPGETPGPGGASAESDA